MAHHPAPASDTEDLSAVVPRAYAWVVFALTAGLLVSDYMSRQVLNAVYPLLKAEWALSDAQLGSLSGVVALMVGLLTVPLSLLADRWGRIKSLTVMAISWSLATLMCGLSNHFGEMFAARLFVGVGEAAYGSVGMAVVLSVFPPSMRATLAGTFLAGGMFGSVLGMALGGVLAARFGWRWSFAGMAAFGLTLALLYSMIVREARIAPPRAKAVHAVEPASTRPPLSSLFDNRSVVSAYIGSGLQLFVGAALLAWIPSFMYRYYEMPIDRAGLVSAVFVLISGAGMIVCGMLSDRLCQHRPERKVTLAIAYCLISCVLLSTAFRLPTGPAQLALIAAGMFLAAGTAGPAGAMVANLTHASIHGTAFATLTLANNLLGLAPGPLVTGVLADRMGLRAAFALVPLISIVAALAFIHARRHYHHDLERIRGLCAPGRGISP